MSTEPTFRKLKLTQQLAVIDLLARVCVKGEDGHAQYLDGYSDDRVGREAVPEYVSNSADGSYPAVERIRRELYGTINMAGRPRKHRAGGSSLKTVTAKLRALCERLGEDYDAL